MPLSSRVSAGLAWGAVGPGGQVVEERGPTEEYAGWGLGAGRLGAQGRVQPPSEREAPHAMGRCWNVLVLVDVRLGDGPCRETRLCGLGSVCGQASVALSCAAHSYPASCWPGPSQGIQRGGRCEAWLAA